ncbi:LSU ribosomal protein L24p (L26e) [Limimaricola cinnabarinus LL-001]|uniref:Large ribosomal subunit protein uL24 n=1 Tax=Limimaricola cinnabarinus LL-001 TaxID=1337093 RepID=U3AKF9_9RHOB|nr:LSU ribosomal protein L24p (L26e) [Limimaricola cinnabarinus LL-001]
MAAKLRKGDKVVVLTGKDKGKTGEILSVNPTAGKAVVEGLNVAIRHVKQSQSDQGGRQPKSMPIQLSNLAIVDANANRPAWASARKTARRSALPRQPGT